MREDVFTSSFFEYKKGVSMRTILVNSANIINETVGAERNVANLIYATAFCNLIRNGTLYKREMGIDGLPRLTITLGNTEFQCYEHLVEKLLNGNYAINPYEDTIIQYEIDELPKPEFIDITSQNNKNTKDKRAKIKKENEETIKDTKEKEEPIEITISEEKQIEALIEQTDIYRTETVMNIALAVVCAVFAIGVMVFF